MIGNRVRVERDNADSVEGVLIRTDATGVIIYKCYGLDDQRIFIPLTRIIEIVDLGRAP